MSKMARRRGFKTFAEARAWGRRRNAMRGRRRARARNWRTGGYMGIELKFYDTFLAQSALDTNTAGEDGEHNPSATISPSTIVQGDGEQNRDGRRATWKSWQVTGTINIAGLNDQATLPEGATIFIAFVLDTQTNGARLDSESVYINPTVDILGGCTLVRNLQQTKRFKVLGTRRFMMPTGASAYSGTLDQIMSHGVNKPFKFFYKWKRTMIANYSGTTETIANSTDNSLHILAWTTSTERAPTITYVSRLRFMG